MRQAPRICYNNRMKINAYAKINLILNVLGKRPDGYHEVEMLMQAIDLFDVVTVEESPAGCDDRAAQMWNGPVAAHVLGPRDFEYGKQDLAYKAALLMAERFRPELITGALDEDGLELAPGVKGIRISVEKRIPPAAGLAGGSADAAAVLVGLGYLWMTGPGTDTPRRKTGDGPEEGPLTAQGKAELLEKLLPLGAELGSDVPFCIASQLGRPAAIAGGRGTELEFVQPAGFGVDLYFSDVVIPNKTRAVYAELKEEDCRERFSIEGFLNAATTEEKRRFMGNHLQAPALRLISKIREEGAKTAQPNCSCKPAVPGFSTVEDPEALEISTSVHSAAPADAVLCGAGPTFFTIGDTGRYRTIIC